MKLSKLMVLMVLVVGMTGLGAAEFSIVDGNGDGNTDSNRDVTGTDGSGNYWLSAFEFTPDESFPTDSASINIEDSYIEASADFHVDVYINEGAVDDQYEEGVKVKDDWQPTNTLEVKEFEFDSDYDFEAGQTYEIEFVTTSDTTSSSAFGELRVATDNSPSTIKHIIKRGSGDIPTEREDYADIVFFAGNQPPQFNSSSVSPDPPLIGENVSYSAEVYDPDADNSQLSTELTVFKDGSQVYQDTKPGTPVNYSDVYAPSSGGDLDARFITTDSAGATTTKWLNRTLTDEAPSVFIQKPSGQKTEYQVDYSVDVTDDDSKPGETISCDFKVNGNVVATHSGTEDFSFNGTLDQSDYSPQNNNLDAVCSDPNGNTGSDAGSFYAWRGYNVTLLDQEDGSNMKNWSIKIENSTSSYFKENRSNPFDVEYDKFPNGDVNITFSDGSDNKYYFNKTVERTLNSTIYLEESVDIKPKPENQISLSFDPGTLIDEGDEVTVEATSEEGSPDLFRDDTGVGNPYTATLSEGFYTFTAEIGETANHAPNNRSDVLQVVAVGEGCTTNQTFAYQKTIEPTSNPYLADFSDFVKNDKVRDNLGDVYSPTENLSLKRTGTDNNLLSIDHSNYTGSEIDLQWGNYYSNRSYETISKPSADKTNLSTYNEKNPYYVLTYRLEQSGDQKLPPGGNTTSTMLCDSGATAYEVEDKRYLVAAKEKLDEVKHTVQYSSTDIYQRNYLPTSKVEFRNIWLVDANKNQVVETLFELRDNTGNYGDGFLRLKKDIGGAERVMTEQFFDAESKTVAYLVNGEKYKLEVVSNDRTSSRSIGNIYTDTVDLTKTIRINEIYDVDPSSGNISYNLYKEQGSVNLDFSFPDGQVSEASLTVYNYSEGEEKNQLYSDSLTNKSSGGLTYSVPNSSENATVMAEYYINSSKFGEIEGSQLFQLSYETPLDDLDINPDTLKAFSVFMIIVIPMFFNPSVARLGALVQVFAAGFFNMIGWIDLSTAAMSSAGTLSLAAILVAIDAYAESEYSRTARRGGR